MAAINNPSSLPQSLFGILPLEIIHEILPTLDPKDLLTARAVCKIFRREIDYLIRQQWKETKHYKR